MNAPAWLIFLVAILVILQQLPESRCVELSNAIAEADAAETWLEKALAVQAERQKESS